LINELRSVRTQLPDGDWDPEPHLGRYVEPVQLQVVCHRLWERIDEDDKITEEEVTQLGSVDESLAGFYEDKVKETAAAVSIPEKDIRTWFDTSLITPNNIRAQVMWEKDRSGGAENKLDNDAIAYLEKTHLIRAESRRGVKWLELAHDRLVKPVRENNRQWFEDPNNLSTLQRQAMLWAAEGEPPRLLLRDQELSEAEAWAAAGQTLSKTEQRFLDECLSQRKQVQDEEEKKKAEALAITNRRLRTRSRIAIFAAGIAILLAIFAGCQTVDARFQAGEAAKQKGTAVAAQATAQSNEELARTAANFAEEESARSLSLNLALNGSTMIDQNPPLAALLSLESLRVSGEKNLLIPPAAEQNIRDLLGVKHEYLLGGHANAVTHTIFSPDEQWLVTADKETGGEGPVRENSVRIWNMEAQDPSRVHAVQGRQLANILQANPDWAAVEISPDSQYIALGDKSGGIILYNLTKQEILTDVFIVPSGKEPDSPVEITTMAIGQQGGRDWLAVGSLDGTVVLIEFSEGSLRNIVTLPGSGIQRINTLAFSKDGRWLAGGSSDRQIRVWDMQRPESTPFSHPAQAGEIWGLAYSEEYLVAYGGSSTLFIYNAREPSNQPNMYTATSSLSEITVVAFDPLDPTRVIVGQADGSTWFLDLASLTSTPVFSAGKGAVTHLVLTPDGRWLVSAGADRRVHLWSLNGSYETGVAEPSTVLRTFEDQINTLQLSPGGKWLAAGSADHSVALW
ncbi:MAG: WD40 repeat domain-containing protein, partial [Chloroflexota bacterium]|nr:WD40 repeat domain-containing protein [Chloroflexota bacterium]